MLLGGAAHDQWKSCQATWIGLIHPATSPDLPLHLLCGCRSGQCPLVHSLAQALFPFILSPSFQSSLQTSRVWNFPNANPSLSFNGKPTIRKQCFLNSSYLQSMSKIFSISIWLSFNELNSFVLDGCVKIIQIHLKWNFFKGGSYWRQWKE